MKRTFTKESLIAEVAKRGLAPAKPMTVGQLRIATVPPDSAIAACRADRMPLTPAQLAEFTSPIHLTVGQQRIACVPTNTIAEPLSPTPEQLAQWTRSLIGHPDGSVSCV